MPVPFVHPDSEIIKGWKEEILWVRATEWPRKYNFNLVMNIWYTNMPGFNEYKRTTQQFVIAKMDGEVWLWYGSDFYSPYHGPDRRIEVPAKFFDMDESAEEMADEMKKWLEDNFCRVTPGLETILTGMS